MLKKNQVFKLKCLKNQFLGLKHLLATILSISMVVDFTKSQLKFGDATLILKYDKPSSETGFRRFDMINNTRTIGIIGKKQYHSIEKFSKVAGAGSSTLDPRSLNPPTGVVLEN